MAASTAASTRSRKASSLKKTRRKALLRACPKAASSVNRTDARKVPVAVSKRGMPQANL